ncbi:MAG: hypothetical protein HOI66_10190 [Verrucomicrobia bacterium]|jgi:integrase|nr:hypothetical protein [Verrucomicrobiota bacterium]
MPRKLELTWWQARKCWRKRITINGKKTDFYFKFGKSKSDVEGYKKALAAWHEKKAELSEREPTNNELHLEKSIRFREQLAEYHRLQEDTERAQLFQSEAETLRKLKRKKNLTNNDVASLVETLTKPKSHEIRIWQENLRTVKQHQKWNQSVTGDNTVAQNAESFIETKRADVPIDLSPGRWDALSRAVREFAEFFGTHRGINEINAKTLTAYRAHLLKRTEHGDFKRKTANDKLKDCRQFIRSCWRLESLENIPRNIDDPALAISYETPKPKAFLKTEIKTLTKGADDRMELFLLLGLNCGMLQQDISDLKPEEVDWDQGRIKRKRSKTRRKSNGNSNIPEVDWKLWGRTFELLKAHRSTSKNHVLLNANGNSLKRSVIGDDGKINNTSNIAKQYERLQIKLKIKKKNRKPFKTLRATGSTILESNKEFSRFAQHYLADAPRSIIEKHYIAHIGDRQDQFDEAIVWMGKQFDLK